jgi:hypothetical protein
MIHRIKKKIVAFELSFKCRVSKFLLLILDLNDTTLPKYFCITSFTPRDAFMAVALIS